MRVPENFIDVYLTILKYSGLWPPEEKRAKFVYFCIFIPIFFTFSIMENITAAIEIFRTRDQFKITMLNIGVIALPLISTFRIVHYQLHITGCKDMMNLIKRKSFNFEKVFDFDFDFEELLRLKKSLKLENYEQIREFWKSKAGNSSKTKAKELQIVNDVEEYRLKKAETANLKSFLAYSFFKCVSQSNVLIAYFSAVSVNFFNKRKAHGQPYERILPYNTYFPFDLQDHFFTAFMYQFTAIFYVLWNLVSVDTFVLIVLVNIVDQLKVMQKAIRSVDKGLEAMEADKAEFLVEVRLIKCYDEIRNLLRLAKLLDSNFNVQLMFQYFGITVMNCMLMFTMPLADSKFEYYTLGVSLVAIVTEPLIFCWFGQTLTEEFSNTFEAVYNTEWYNRSAVFQKKLVFAMMPTQTPVSLSLGKIIHINLQFFIGLLRASYSFYTLISTRPASVSHNA